MEELLRSKGIDPVPYAFRQTFDKWGESPWPVIDTFHNKVTNVRKKFKEKLSPQELYELEKKRYLTTVDVAIRHKISILTSSELPQAPECIADDDELPNVVNDFAAEEKRQLDRVTQLIKAADENAYSSRDSERLGFLLVRIEGELSAAALHKKDVKKAIAAAYDSRPEPLKETGLRKFREDFSATLSPGREVERLHQHLTPGVNPDESHRNAEKLWWADVFEDPRKARGFNFWETLKNALTGYERYLNRLEELAEEA